MVDGVLTRRILIVDDEEYYLRNVQSYLSNEGYETHIALDGSSALRAARAFHPDLILLDIMLPGMDGLEVLRLLRQESDVYILMLTAKADETDKVIGLNMGADDYLAKPFGLRELTARVKAILRRGRAAVGRESELVYQSMRIDPAARKAWIAENDLDLTPIEYDLLYALARHPNRVLSREQLIEHVWGNDYYGDDRVVDVHIGRLRRKLKVHPTGASIITTVRGAGYRFEDQPR